MTTEPKHVAAFKTKSNGVSDLAILVWDSVDCVVFAVFSVLAAVKIDGVQLQRNASGQTRDKARRARKRVSPAHSVWI